MKNKKKATWTVGQMVGCAGFEPATLCLKGRYSTY